MLMKRIPGILTVILIVGGCFWATATLAAEETSPSASVTTPASPPIRWLDRVTRDLDAGASTESLAAHMKTPPASTRVIKIIHAWPGTPEAQDGLLHDVEARGYGGVVSNVWNLEKDEEWRSFQRGVTEAKKAGLTLWLYDEAGYPSGRAGGIVLKDHPEWEAWGLLTADQVTTGGTVSLDLPPGQLRLAAAYPVEHGQLVIDQAVDLKGQVKDGKMNWVAPAGQWHVMAIAEGRLFDGTHTGLSGVPKGMPYINLLRPEPTRKFIEVTHDRYARLLGDDLGKYFVSTFTDEPSLMSLFLWKPMPYKPLPWASNLPAEFRQRRGYELEPWIPALVADAGPQGIKARYDFWRTIAELVSDNYFGALQNWCGEHGLASGGHLLLEENLTQHVALYGDFFRCLRRLDIPGIDVLSGLAKDSPWYTARLVRSAADLEGKPFAMCETCDLRDPKEQDLDEIRGLYNRLMLGGIDAHTTYFPLSKFTPEQVRSFNEWVGRCTLLLTGGRPTAEIAVLYPIESLWARYTPIHGWHENPPAAQPVQDVYLKALDTLYSAQRDFTCIDSRTLSEATVTTGSLRHGDLKWRVIILPMVDTLPPSAWAALQRFWESGGTIISLGVLPANTDSDFPSPEVQSAGRKVFGEGNGPRVVIGRQGGAAVFLPQARIDLLAAALDGLQARDLTVSDQRSPVRMVHRRANGHEVYFLINDSPTPWAGQVSFASSGEGEQWDPATGQMTRLETNRNVQLKLGSYGAMLFRFKQEPPVERLTPDPARLPGFELRTVTP